MGVDRHTLLTPPVPEEMEGPWRQGCPGPARLPGALSSPRQPELIASRAMGLALPSQTPRKVPTQAAANASDIPTISGYPLYCEASLPECVYCRSPAPPRLSASSAASPTTPLVLTGLSSRHVDLPPLYTLCSCHALLSFTFLDTLPRFHSPSQSHLLQEGLCGHSNHGNLSSLRPPTTFVFCLRHLTPTVVDA